MIDHIILIYRQRYEKKIKREHHKRKKYVFHVTKPKELTYIKTDGFINESLKVKNQQLNNKKVMNNLSKTYSRMRTMKKLAVCVAFVFVCANANAQNKDFDKLAKIEGVEFVHFDKSMINLAAKTGTGLHIGESINIGDQNGDNLNQLNDVKVFVCEEKKTVQQLKTAAMKLLKGKEWEPLIDTKGEDGEMVKIYQAKKGEQITNAILVIEEEEAQLVILDGTFDITKMMGMTGDKEDEANNEVENPSKNQNMSFSIKTTTWEDLDKEKEPRKYRDCLIVIDGEIHPELHTQSEAARYMYERDLQWEPIVDVIEGKDVKKKYHGTKKKVAIEYTTHKKEQ